MAEPHSMKIGIPAETRQGERRVALVPDVASRLIRSGFTVLVEAGAGEQADFTDDAYREVGVVVEADRQALLDIADVVLSVQPLRVEDVAKLQASAVTISFLQSATQGLVVEALAAHNITALSLDLLPRTAGHRAWTRCPRSRRWPATRQY